MRERKRVMKKTENYISPRLDIVLFTADDIITGSLVLGGFEGELDDLSL